MQSVEWESVCSWNEKQTAQPPDWVIRSAHPGRVKRVEAWIGLSKINEYGECTEQQTEARDSR